MMEDIDLAKLTKEEEASLYHEERKSWPTKNGVPLRRGVKKLRY